ncbi:MAG: type IV secretion system DNA-binding domain-containing protein [Patescibacteria group bacterium]|nr:type IV secretion system DNA-binding domain-containing protein [Patescibacteria group bacterium]
MPDDTNNKDIALFAQTNFRNQRRSFGIKLDDRRRHMYVIGKTGMGKTTLLQQMIVADITAGRGVALVDPHGDLAEEILDYIPADRINDVIYFNPADIDYPIAFNVLESVNPVHRHLVASGLVGVFKKIWADSWGPRLEYVLRNTVLSLLEYPGSTLLGITRLLVDNKYRKKVVSKINDPILRTFWLEEYAAYGNQFRTEAISPIQNKVGQFLSSSVIRNIVGQTKSSVDMREIMDTGKILIMNLSKGRIGEDNAALLGAMMITKLQLAAMSRVDIPEEERRDFFLYVDEFQNFATESFANILSEARKYRLDLIIAHQYIEQLDEEVQAAVFGNVGTIVAFRVGATDAEYLEKEFEPVFMQNDLVNLTKFEMYLKLMIDGVASEPFSAHGLPPLHSRAKEGNLEKIIRVSRERYATPRAVVEDKIMRWSGMAEMEQGENGENGQRREEKEKIEKMVFQGKVERNTPTTYPEQGRGKVSPRPETRQVKPRETAPDKNREGINFLRAMAGDQNAPAERKKEAKAAPVEKDLKIVEEASSIPTPISLKEALTREPMSFKNFRKPQNQQPRFPRRPGGQTQSRGDRHLRPGQVIHF